jgi:hypothetical protein
MDYSAGFVPSMLKAMHDARDVVGTDVMVGDPSRYREIVQTLALFGVVAKAIQDLHPDKATDAEWASRLSRALDTGPNGDKGGWPGWVVLQVPPTLLARYGGTLTDSVPVLQAKIDAWLATQGQ